MESTILDKALFLSQYIGQKITYPRIGGGKPQIENLTGVSLKDGVETTYNRKKDGCVGDYLSWKGNGNHNSDALHACLLLRPLSAITDEEAIMVKKILRLEGETEAGFDVSVQAIKEDLACGFQDLLVIDFYGHSVEVYQYLQSRGFLLPFRQYSTGHILELGWVKIKEI